MWLHGCFLLADDPERDLQVVDVSLFQAKHAVSIPLRRFAAPATHAADAPCTEVGQGDLSYASIDVALDGLSMGGEDLGVSMERGVVVPGEKRGHLVSVVYDRLLSLAEVRKDIDLRCGTGTFRGELLLGVDPRVPWGTVAEVVFTAAQAQFGRVALRVSDPSTTARTGLPTWTEADGWVDVGPATVRFGEVASARQPVAQSGLSARLGRDEHIVVSGQEGVATGQVLEIVDQVHEANWAWVDANQIPRTPQAASVAGGPIPTRKLPPDGEVAVLWLSHVRVGPRPSPEAAPGPVASESFGPPEPADEEVATVIRRHRNQLRYCYQRQLTKQPELQGSFVVRFRVGSDGSTSEVEVLEDDLQDRAVSACVQGRFLRMQFSAPSAGVYRYPIAFRPLQR